jgi:hypothetical protein
MSQTSATRNPAPKAPPLSNAERQRRWRERLKAKASGAAVTEHARDVVARAIMALWDYHERPGPGGIRWADVDGCSCIEDYVCELAAEDRGLAMAARAFLPGFEGLTPEEARALAALIALADVIDMRDTREDIMLGRLLLPATAQSAKMRTTTPGNAGLALVPAHAADDQPNKTSDQDRATDRDCASADVSVNIQPEDDGPEGNRLEGNKIVRLSVAQRARRRARLQKWK